MSAAPSRRLTVPRPAAARTLWRHAFEGALSTVAATVAMAAVVRAALAFLGADAIAPASRLVPAVVSTAFGGGITLTSVASGGGGDGNLGADGSGGLLGGSLELGLTGVVSTIPLTVTFVGTAVLALGFFRPLHRRPQPASELLWARFGGALAAAAVVFPFLAGTAHGTARLPAGVTERFGRRDTSPGPGPFGGGLGDGLSSAAFETDVAVTVFFGLLWVCVVLGIGCVAARRTTPSRHLALGQARRSWHAVTSALSGITAVLCCSVLALALTVAGLAALTGHEQAARAAGALLLVGPNLIAVLLTAGLGTPWGAGVQRLTPQGGGMLGGLGGAGSDRSVDLGGWAGAGVPLWLLGLLLVVLLAVIAGYLAAARTPARTRQEEARAVFGRNTEIAVRLGIAVGAPFLLLPLAARGSLGIGVSLMGQEMGGVAAGLDASPGLSAVAAALLATTVGYGGIRLHGRRARRRQESPQAPHEEPGRAGRPAPSPALAPAGSSRSASGPTC
ncbi:streptophobe family protein [Kitasatospora sp. NPDC058032]|uniref:streptophobe family protein n=1 Tax=Kitasatospora sp. NPDC058032 TaxID=3346307 RepID=UPI0036DB1DDA